MVVHHFIEELLYFRRFFFRFALLFDLLWVVNLVLLIMNTLDWVKEWTKMESLTDIRLVLLVQSLIFDFTLGIETTWLICMENQIWSLFFIFFHIIVINLWSDINMFLTWFSADFVLVWISAFYPFFHRQFKDSFR